jgi:O-antigen ligase
MSAVELTRHAIGVRPGVRWAIFLTCAAAFFVLSYSSATTWGEVQSGLSEGFGAQLASMARGNESGNLNRQLAGVALGLVGAAALVTRRAAAQLRPRGALGWLVIAYVTLYALSITWADEPQLTLRRIIAFGMMGVAVAGVVRLLSVHAIVAFALFASAAYVAVALAAECATGALRPLAEGYRFSGLFHPNTVGSFCVVLVAALVVGTGRTRRRGLVALTLAAAVAVLLLTRSRSALIGLASALALRWVVAARLGRQVLVMTVVAWIACAAYLTYGEALVPTVEKTVLMSREDSNVETLSGRTALWEELLRYTAQRPVLGYGLGGFWGARHVYEVFLSQRWPVAEAHSTYVEQLLDVGVVGLVLYVLVMALAVVEAVRRLRVTHHPAYGFMFCVLVYFLVAGSLETMQPNPSLPTFLLFWSLGFLAFRGERSAGGRPCAST